MQSLKKHIAYLLLLVYTFSIIPTSFLHQHAHSRVALSQADACEQKIFYGKQTTDCGHQQHISETIKKCSICDHHIVAPHILSSFYFYYKQTRIVVAKQNYLEKICWRQSVQRFSRGPPIMCS